jgi:tRNA(Ile)-lysidine synthetase-like protein
MDLQNNKNLDELKTFWFNNRNIWFNCKKEDDELIKNKYTNLLHYNINNKEPSLSLIILYDQITRHIYRNQQEEIKLYSAISLEHTNKLLSQINDYKPEERCFILMPLRHTFMEDNLNLCLSYVTNWMKTENDQIYSRFYEATITALSRINNNKPTLFINTLKCDYTHILDPNSIKHVTFEFNNDIYDNHLYQEFALNMTKNKNTDIIVSLSGGVDSMVCSFLLYYYCKLNNNNPKAVTINYHNRPEQDLEIIMVNDWVKLLGFEHNVRNITEISRQHDKHREFYEKITREIRFNIYKKVGGSIILGHNKDDSLENIFSNIKKKKHYKNLLGMSIYSNDKDGEIFRPLLNINKKEIIDFANKYKIPYVYDSTPSWSERGKMRDILIPQIINFDKDIIPGLFELSNNLQEIYKIYKLYCMPTITFHENDCYFDYKEINFLDYWRNIINIICKHYNCKTIRSKSILYLIRTIKYGRPIVLSKNISCKLENNIVKVNIL